MNLLNRSILAGVMALGIAACRHDGEDLIPPVVPEEVPHNATLRINWTFVRGEHSYTLDTLLQDSTHRDLKVDDIRFYVSGIQALNDEQEVIGHYEDQHYLVDIAQDNDLLLGSIFASHIHEYTMELGVEAAENNGDPATAPAPLNDTTMHWAMPPPQGYKFLRVRGHYDADGDGDVDASDPEFSYACGTDALLTNTYLHLHHDFIEGEIHTCQAHVNMGLLFDHIDVSNTPTGAGADSVCARMMQNLSDVIFGEEH